MPYIEPPFEDETISIALERTANLQAEVMAEVRRLLKSGAIDPKSHDRGLLLGVAVENIADNWLRNERKRKDYKNLKCF